MPGSLVLFRPLILTWYKIEILVFCSPGLPLERSFMLHRFKYGGVSRPHSSSRMQELFIVHNIRAFLSLRIVTGEAGVAISEIIAAEHHIQIPWFKIS